MLDYTPYAAKNQYKQYAHTPSSNIHTELLPSGQLSLDLEKLRYCIGSVPIHRICLAKISINVLILIYKHRITFVTDIYTVTHIDTVMLTGGYIYTVVPDRFNRDTPDASA